MALRYGVLRARPHLAKREDGAATPHLQIRALDATGQPWRVAVNVQSDDGSEVVFWIVDPLVGHPILGALAAMSSGFTTTAANSSASLDYVKAPLFDFSLGRALPPSGSANGDDLRTGTGKGPVGVGRTRFPPHTGIGNAVERRGVVRQSGFGRADRARVLRSGHPRSWARW